MKPPDTDEDEIKNRRICSACVGEDYLKAKIDAMAEEEECFYCQKFGNTCFIDQLVGEIDQAFEVHYQRTPTNPEGYEAAMHSDKELDYEWERRGESALWAIANAAEIDERPAEDIRSILAEQYYDHEAAKMGEELPFSRDSQYELKDHGCEEFSQKWRDFERGLKTEARYLSRSAQAILVELFGDVAKLVVGAGASVITSVGPDKNIFCLFRARIFAAENEKLSDALKHPWKHLGPPPMQAAVAGRMNARGISVFYGAIESGTAIAEVRPPVGSQVAVAKFDFIRELCLLDLEALKRVTVSGSIFDREFVNQIQRAKFLEILSERMTRPVMPNEEAFEYLATQAVADFLATEIRLDGIVFPSVQVGHASSNVVLFRHASRVEETKLPPGTRISVSLEDRDEDGARPDYTVWEETSSTPPAAKTTADIDLLSIDSGVVEDFDPRIPSLRIDAASVTVHHVKAVSFSVSSHTVTRHRFEKPTGSPPF